MSTNSGGNSPTITQNNEAEVCVKRDSWAAVLEKSLVRISNKNVLEVILKKDFRGSFVVSQLECPKFLMKLGLDMRQGGPIDAIS